MSEPRRLLTDVEGATPFERDLLESYAAEQPSAAARARALGIATVAAGTVATIGATAGAAGAAAPKAAGLAGLAIVKWVLVGVAVAGSATAAVVAVRSDHDRAPLAVTASPAAPPTAPTAPRATPAPTTATPATPEPVVEPLAISPADLEAAPAVAAPVGPSGHVASATVAAVAPAPPVTAAPSGGSLPAEIAALDRARRSLESGDPAQALAQVDAYEARYPNGTFSEEAEVLRIEALVKRGDRTRAASVGQRFLAAHPASPHAPRIRAILSPSNPATTTLP